MPSKAYTHFTRNMDTVSRLQDTFETVKRARNSRGKGAFDHITRSAILFLVSSFEVYCEELICECCEKSISAAKDANKLPHSVRSMLNDYVYKNKKINPLDYCDEGWKNVYRNIAKERTDALNTPDVKHIKELFCSLIGVENVEIEAISGMDKLDGIILFRGEIIHRVKPNSYVTIDMVREKRGIIEMIAIGLDRTMSHFIKEYYVIKAPWNDTY